MQYEIRMPLFFSLCLSLSPVSHFIFVFIESERSLWMKKNVGSVHIHTRHIRFVECMISHAARKDCWVTLTKLSTFEDIILIDIEMNMKMKRAHWWNKATNAKCHRDVFIYWAHQTNYAILERKTKRGAGLNPNVPCTVFFAHILQRVEAYFQPFLIYAVDISRKTKWIT